MGESEPHPTPARPRNRRSRALTGVGYALIVAGAGVLAYVGFELYGTTWLAQRAQDRAVEATQRAWSTEGPRSASREDRELARDVVALVRVPALGREYVVPAYRGTDDDTLARGFGIFDSSPGPGEVGNFALGGHRITQGEPLRGMPSLEAGDIVVVESRDATYRYVLDTDGDSRTVGTDATWVTDTDPVDPATGQPVSEAFGSTRLLTLVTCAEIFHSDDRLVAFGHLVKRDP
jgi:sortase A